ncbi:MAG: flagellar hook-basal body complex protein FliE [Methanoregula sp.]|nr:flagellar hook-basal body complex protein FliE [Methanoregula sp.]
MKVIGVVGLPASGKGEFSKIAAQRGIPVVIMGDMIRNAVHNEGIEPTDANLGAMANKLRASRGMDAIAQLCVPEIQRRTSPIVLVDGIRGDAEVTLFRRVFPGFILISIDSSFETRLARIRVRGRSDDLSSADELHARDKRELSWGLGNALNDADVHLSNEGTLADFGSVVNAFFDTVEHNP